MRHKDAVETFTAGEGTHKASGALYVDDNPTNPREDCEARVREVKVVVSAARLAIAARTKAPFCGVQWAERARPLVVPTKFLRAAMSHPEAKRCRAYVVSNGSPENPLELVITGKGFAWRLKHQQRTVQQLEAMREWAAGMRKRLVLATPELRMDARRQRQLREATRRLEFKRKRIGLSYPEHPLRVHKRDVAEWGKWHSAEWYGERAEHPKRDRQVRQTLGRIAARFLRERGRHWQRELKAALAERGLQVSYGFSRLSKLQSGRWAEGDPDTYLKALWRDVSGCASHYYDDGPRDPAKVIERCREWRDVELPRYMEWKQTERMLQQDISDIQSGMHVMEAGDAEAEA